MKREYHAHFAFALLDTTTQAFALDWLVGKSPRAPHRWQEAREVGLETDDFARLMILVQAIVTGHKDRARVGGRKDPSGLYYWIRHKSDKWLRERLNFMHNVLELEADSPLPYFLPDLSLFPPGSWAVQVHFTLKKPYISIDDGDFYIIDNPVKKEWVFKVPYVAPSQWKGTLRAVMRRRRGYTSWEKEAQDEQMVRLFGNVKGAEVDFSAGRLHFYPTFFDRIGLEVINPHDRKTGAGKNPIYFECVPAGTEGVFTLLYVPLDQVGRSSREEIEQEAKADLKAVAEGVKAMLTEYGFGAKTSSGYGVVEGEEATVVVKTNVPGWFKAAPSSETTEVVPPDEAFLKYLDETGEVKGAFKGSGEGGLLSNSEYKERGQSLGGGALAEFRRFRAWYLKHGAAWRASQSEQKPADPSAQGSQQKTFNSLSEFVQAVHSLANGGGQES